MTFKVLEKLRCPGCKRALNPRRKHRTQTGGGTWCSGRENKLRDEALRALVQVHSTAADMIMSSRYEEALALLRPALARLNGEPSSPHWTEPCLKCGAPARTPCATTCEHSA